MQEIINEIGSEKLVHRFEFDESNFINLRKEINDFRNNCSNNQININYIRQLPPCITKDYTSVMDRKKFTIFNHSNIILNSSILYGEQYIELNKIFTKSPFISQNCKNCEYNKNHTCRGLFNNQFLKQRLQIIDRIGLEEYDTVKSDYENGQFVGGSQCNKNCKFCFDKQLPNHITRTVHTLLPSEIAHFLHYLPKKIINLNGPFHSKCGEVFESPYLNDIVKIIKPFCDRPLMIITRGDTLTEEIMDTIKDLDPLLGISVNTLNKELSQEFMPGSRDVNLRKLISELKKRGLKYQFSIVPLKSLVETGDFDETVKLIREDNPNIVLRINPPTWSNYISDDMITELKEGYNEVKRKYYEKDNHSWFMGEDEINGSRRTKHSKKIEIVKQKIKEITKPYNYKILLAPSKTHKTMSELDDENTKTINVESVVGFSNPCAGILRVEDYIRAIGIINPRLDCIVIPRKTFDINFEDISRENINKLWSKIKDYNIDLVFG